MAYQKGRRAATECDLKQGGTINKQAA